MDGAPPLSGEFKTIKLIGDRQKNDLETDAKMLLSRLSFSHFIELMKCDSPTKRAFYEVYAIKNNCSIRELKRAMETMLFERTSLSTNKKSALEKIKSDTEIFPEDLIKKTLSKTRFVTSVFTFSSKLSFT